MAAAVCARDQLGVDLLHVVVTNDPWQKSAERSVTPARHRLAMTQLAFEGHNDIAVSNMEIQRGGPTYTIDTVTTLAEGGAEGGTETTRPQGGPAAVLDQGDAGTALSQGAGEVLLVVGPTAASGISTWHRAAELAQRVTLAVVQPPGGPPVQIPGWRTCAVRMAPMAASATLVRALLARREAPDHPLESARLVPPRVMSYIIEHSLYSP